MNNPAIKILFAEDEPSLAMIVKESLESRSFYVDHHLDGAAAYKAFEKESYDIAVLDVMMPKMDGYELAKRIRANNQAIPIVFLTAKSQTEDVLKGFDVGGNDYLKKPFSMEELIVRIHNLLDRKKVQTSSQEFGLGGYSFNFPQQKLVYQEQDAVKLTHRESHLLYHLIQNKNQVLDRSYILQKLWGNDDFFSGRSMDVFISKLRKKLASDPSLEIVNVRGYGYKLIES
ncbi:response regulator transcription factor [Nonlabens ponticola]|uniref:Response regulator transcription factor n=1 Tax=Nonlabens ponticola TaxID=2496866 RepID=A0A3S9MWF4_9FLAO|nr:response regulator transcription factor [Nonlabens ponticola]AZQ43459.1 response regulator transcription factor [Nonlabens ponticola]